MHNASDRNHVGSRSGKPPHGDHDLGPDQGAHTTARARLALGDHSGRRPSCRIACNTEKAIAVAGAHSPLGRVLLRASEFRAIEDEDSLDPVGGRRGCQLKCSVREWECNGVSSIFQSEYHRAR